MSDRSELLDKIEKYRFNPAGIQRAIIDQVERTYKGELEIVDPMNPFVFAVESASVIGAAQMIQAEALTRQQYPSMAQSIEELYLHMSDKDYVDRFSTPSTTVITVLLGKEEVYARAVATGSGGIRKLTIPRNTAFTVGGSTFTMQYPIDIRIMSHGGLQIVYNNDRPSPIQTLESNQVDWSILNYNAMRAEYIRINIPIQQFKITSVTASLNGVRGFKKTYTIDDNFYYCRAYMADRSGNWVEIQTTHTDQVFDPLNPTLVLRVNGNQVTTLLPLVYFNTGLLNTELRIDFYTTKGPLDLPLQSYEANQFVAKWVDLDKDDNGVYYAPLTRMNTISVFGERATLGGSLGMSFEEQRQRLMNNILGVNDIPVTTDQLLARLETVGFSSVKHVDNVTNRIYLATKTLPKPTTGNLSTGMGAGIGQLNTTIEDLDLLSTTAKNDAGTRVTILPNTLYRDNNGIMEVVRDQELALLRSYSLDKLTDKVNNDRFLFSPFHYVLDISNNTFETRPYYFGNPTIEGKMFVDENDTVGVGVSTNTHAFERTDYGWRLLVLTSSGPGFQDLPDDQINVQLACRPSDEVALAYVNGTLLTKDEKTKERLYEFRIETNWDLDVADDVCITNFTMYDDVPRKIFVNLQTDFELIFVISNRVANGQKTSYIDDLIGKHILPDVSVGLYHERLKLKLGDSLDGLWTRSRTVIGENDYQRYTADVIQTYTENVYERDVTGAATYTIVDGKMQFNLLHRAGDPVLDYEGNPVILFPAGWPVLDSNGQPVPIAPRKLRRVTDLFVMDGIYFFATTDSDKEYSESIPATIVSWLNDVIAPMSKKLLEETYLYYHPKTTIGLVDTVVDAGEEVKLYAEQRLLVNLYVTQAVYRDTALREILAQNTVTSLASMLNRQVVTTTEIVATIKSMLGGDVITVELEGLGGVPANIPAITIKDESARLCIGKRLAAMPDNTLEVQDAVTVNFIRHQTL